MRYGQSNLIFLLQLSMKAFENSINLRGNFNIFYWSINESSQWQIPTFSLKFNRTTNNKKKFFSFIKYLINFPKENPSNFISINTLINYPNVILTTSRKTRWFIWQESQNTQQKNIFYTQFSETHLFEKAKRVIRRKYIIISNKMIVI